MLNYKQYISTNIGTRTIVYIFYLMLLLILRSIYCIYIPILLAHVHTCSILQTASGVTCLPTQFPCQLLILFLHKITTLGENF